MAKTAKTTLSTKICSFYTLKQYLLTAKHIHTYITMFIQIHNTKRNANCLKMVRKITMELNNNTNNSNNNNIENFYIQPTTH